MTPVQVALSEALTSLPSRSRPTITTLQHQGVEVTCWSGGKQWILRGQLKAHMHQTLPTPMRTGHSVDNLWRRMKPVIEDRNHSLPKR
ncbi:hypothetical protein ACFFLM_26100 [Deinococcus oregonensis]|uniref:Type II toxin-antitoxin system HicA family toxin n=1 Tax=Deinococcus oregonensis TaxID=1805970 RepID=A0ABV6B6L9_9DEIO